MKYTGHTVTIERDGLQNNVSTDRVSLTPSLPMADHSQETMPCPASNKDTPLKTVQIPAASGPAPPSPMAATLPNPAQKLRDPKASSTLPTSTISADSHGLTVSTDDDYDAKLREEDDQWNTPGVSRRNYGYDTYMPEHDDHR